MIKEKKQNIKNIQIFIPKKKIPRLFVRKYCAKPHTKSKYNRNNGGTYYFPNTKTIRKYNKKHQGNPNSY